MDAPYFLSLCENPLNFEPLRKMTNDVFYDDKLNEIFTVIYADNMTEVCVENVMRKNKKIYTIKDKRHVISVKFSHDQKILAIQRSTCTVDFITFRNGEQYMEFSKGCKVGNSKILGFIWISNTEILYITNQGLELYQVELEKRILKLVKEFTTMVSWFLSYSRKNFILLCTGSPNIYLLPVYVFDGNFKKLPKFEVIGTCVNYPQNRLKCIPILERDVTVTFFYGQIRIMVFQHNQNETFHSNTEISVYTIHKRMTVKRTHVLYLKQSGRFALNVVDDLIIVHDQISKTSNIFDIGLPGLEQDSFSAHFPIVKEKTIMPTGVDSAELYSAHWVTFQPDIIIDVVIGYFWFLKIHLDCFMNYIADKCILVDYFMLRASGKEYVMKVLCTMIQNVGRELEDIGRVFNRINVAYKNKLESLSTSNVGFICSTSVPLHHHKSGIKVVIKQSEIYADVLTKIANSSIKTSKPEYLTYVLLEYIRSLADYKISVEHCIYEMLINTLILNKSFQQLHQIVQYRLVADTKRIACLLLSLENIYQPCHQLALDMLHRIGDAPEEIIEILLSKNHVVSAVRFYDENGNDNEVLFRKYLDVAAASNDPRIFYSVFKEFQKNKSAAGENIWQFPPGNHYNVYINSFLEQFQQNPPENITI